MTSCEPYRFIICYINQWIWRLVPLPLIVFGTIGNILNLAILFRRRMRKFSTTVYLIGLAGADLVTIWSGLLPGTINWITGYNIQTYSTLCCQSLKFLSNCAGGYSIYLIVLMTIERMVLTVSPIIARTTLNVRNAVTFASLTLLLCLIFSAHMFGLEVQTVQTNTTVGNQSVTVDVRQCEPSDGHRWFYVNIWPFMIMFVLVVIPFTFIAIGNGVILISLLLQKRRLRKVMPTGQHGSTMSAYKKRKSATKTLLLISSMFLGTTFPMTVTNIVFPAAISPDPYYEAVKTLAKTLTYQLVIVNFTFNFVLYFVSGTLFKQELKALFREIYSRFRKMFHLAAIPDSQATVMATESSSTRQQRYPLNKQGSPKMP